MVKITKDKSSDNLNTDNNLNLDFYGDPKTENWLDWTENKNKYNQTNSEKSKKGSDSHVPSSSGFYSEGSYKERALFKISHEEGENPNSKESPAVDVVDPKTINSSSFYEKFNLDIPEIQEDILPPPKRERKPIKVSSNFSFRYQIEKGALIILNNNDLEECYDITDPDQIFFTDNWKKSLLQFILDDETPIEEASSLLIWFINNRADLSVCSTKNENLFTRIINTFDRTKNWPILELLLNSNSNFSFSKDLSEGVNNVFNLALQEKQLLVITKLLEINKKKEEKEKFIEKISVYFLTDLFYLPTDFSLNILDELLKQDLIELDEMNLQMFKNLTTTFFKNNINKNAFFYSSFIKTFDGKHLNIESSSKSSVTSHKSTNDRSNFKCYLNHSVMQSLYGNFMDSKIVRTTDCLNFFIKGLESLKTLGVDTKYFNLMSMIIKQLENAFNIALRLESIASIKSIQTRGVALETLAVTIIEDIKKLEEGSSLILPCGWNNLTDYNEGKNLLLQVYKSKQGSIKLSLYNATERLFIIDYFIAENQYQDPHFFVTLYEFYIAKEKNTQEEYYHVLNKFFNNSYHQSRDFPYESGYSGYFRLLFAFIERVSNADSSKMIYALLVLHTTELFVKSEKEYNSIIQKNSSLKQYDTSSLALNFPFDKIETLLTYLKVNNSIMDQFKKIKQECNPKNEIPFIENKLKLNNNILIKKTEFKQKPEDKKNVGGDSESKIKEKYPLPFFKTIKSSADLLEQVETLNKFLKLEDNNASMILLKEVYESVCYLSKEIEKLRKIDELTIEKFSPYIVNLKSKLKLFFELQKEGFLEKYLNEITELVSDYLIKKDCDLFSKYLLSLEHKLVDTKDWLHLKKIDKLFFLRPYVMKNLIKFSKIIISKINDKLLVEIKKSETDLNALGKNIFEIMKFCVRNQYEKQDNTCLTAIKFTFLTIVKLSESIENHNNLFTIKKNSFNEECEIFELTEDSSFSLSDINTSDDFVNWKFLRDHWPKRDIDDKSLFNLNNFLKKSRKDDDSIEIELNNTIIEYFKIFLKKDDREKCLSSVKSCTKNNNQKDLEQFVDRYLATQHFLEKKSAPPYFFYLIELLFAFKNIKLEDSRKAPFLIRGQIKSEEELFEDEEPLTLSKSIISKPSTFSNAFLPSKYYKEIKKINIEFSSGCGFSTSFNKELLFLDPTSENNISATENKSFSLLNTSHTGFVEELKKFYQTKLHSNTGVFDGLKDIYQTKFHRFSLHCLIDSYEKNKNVLTEGSYQLFFAYHLQQRNSLHTELLNEKSNFVTKFFSFINNTLDHFQNEFSTSINKHKSLSAMVFLLEQKLFILNVSKEYNSDIKKESSVLERVANIRIKINELISAFNDVFKNKNRKNQKDKEIEVFCTTIEQRLYQLLLLSYQSQPKKLKDFDIVNLINSRVELQRLDIVIYYQDKTNNGVSEKLKKEAENVVIDCTEEILQFLENDPDTKDNLFSRLLKTIHLEAAKESLGWKNCGQGVFAKQINKNQMIEINVLTGNICCNNKTVWMVPKMVYLDPKYQEAIGSPLSSVEESVHLIKGVDESGSEVQISVERWGGFSTLKEVFRKFNNLLYQYSPDTKTEIALFKNIPIKGLNIWKSSNDEEENSIIFCKPRTHEIVYRYKEGYLYFETEPDVACVFDPASDFKFMDPDTYYLTKHSQDKESKQLIFPNCKLEGKPLVFTLQKESWYLENRTLKLQEEQKINNLRGFNKFFVLNGNNGDQKSIIIWENCCTLVEMSGNFLTPKNIFNSYLVSYLTLFYSKDKNDYKQSLKFLMSAPYAFFKYTQEEISILQKITDIHKELKNPLPECYSICLYAAWLLEDNLKRNPEEGESQPIIEDLIDLSKKYIKVESFLSSDFILKSYLSESEIKRFSVFQSVLILNNKPKKDYNDNYNDFNGALFAKSDFSKDNKNKKEIINLLNVFKKFTRTERGLKPGTYNLKNNFYSLYELAISDKKENNQHVEKYLLLNQDIMTEYKSDENHSFYCGLIIILKSILYLKKANNDNMSRLCRSVKELIEAVQQDKFIDFNESDTQVFERQQQGAITLIEKINECLKQAKTKLEEDSKKAPVLESDLPRSTIEENYWKESLLFYLKEKKNDFQYQTHLNTSEFDTLYEKYFFSSKIKEETNLEKITIPGVEEDVLIKKHIEEFQKDYEKGCEKNSNYTRHNLKKNSSYNELILELEKGQKKCSKAIEDLIQKLNKRTNNLELMDYKKMFLMSSKEEFSKKIGVENSGEFNEIYNMIGDLFYAKSIEGKYNRSIKLLEKNNWDTKEGLESFATELSTKHAYNPKEHLPAFLIFEVETGTWLLPYQLEGIQKLFNKDSNESVIIQWLQGGGKTFFLGPTLASLYSSQGKNLYIHVAPTSNYPTDLANMSKSSREIFDQKEFTFKFNGLPIYFNKEYLTTIKGLIINAIKNQSYITLTKETLWSMRATYIKSFFDEKPDFEALALLESILILMKSSAIFTIDEIDEFFNPNKELNIPIGRPQLPPMDELSVICTICQFAIQACDKEGHLLLNIGNNHPLQVDSVWDCLTEEILNSLFTQEPWKGIIQNNEDRKKMLRKYLLEKNQEFPEILKNTIEATQKSAVLIHLLIAEKGLKSSLKKYVDQNMGFSNKNPLRISIPYSSNMTPIENSEFSHLYVTVMNTLICYTVNGLTAEQVVEFVNYLKEKIVNEKEFLEENNPYFDPNDCPSRILFKKAMGKDLYSIDMENVDLTEKLQKQLRDQKNLLMGEVFHFLQIKVFSQLKIYSEGQVKTTGQDIVSMTSKILGYSGSINSLTLSGSLFLEEGTNGQTIDLFFQRSSDISMIEDKTGALFDLLESLNEPSIRAIIDIGCYFRGVANKAVACDIAKTLKTLKSSLKGVLFFDAKDNLCCLVIENKQEYILSGTDITVIESETGFKREELFAFFGQQHLRGVNILLPETNTTALVTIGGGTDFNVSNFTQGLRRLRNLPNQKIIPVLTKKERLNIAEKLSVNMNKESFDKKHIISFAVLNEFNSHSNLEICLQKMSGFIQGLLLAKCYEIKNWMKKTALIKECKDLFITNTVINLLDYLEVRDSVLISEFIEKEKNKLLKFTEKYISSDERKDAEKHLESIIEKHLSSLPKKIEVGKFSFNESTRIQEVIIERSIEKQAIQIPDPIIEEDEDKDLNLFEALKSTLFTSKKDFFKVSKFDGSNKCLKNSLTYGNIAPSEIWSLSQVVSYELKNNKALFSPNLLISSNYGLTYEGELSVVSNKRKPIQYAWLVYNNNSEKENKYSLVIISNQDAIQLEKIKNQLNFPDDKNNKIWLFNSNGEFIESMTDHDKLDSFPDEVSNLFIEFFIFAGNIEALEKRRWRSLLNNWIQSKEAKDIIDFLEKRLSDLPISYYKSNLYNRIHSKLSIEKNKMDNVISFDIIKENQEDEDFYKKTTSLIQEVRKLPLKPINSEITESYKLTLEKIKNSFLIFDKTTDDVNWKGLREYALKYVGDKKSELYIGDKKSERDIEIYQSINLIFELFLELKSRLKNPKPLDRMIKNFNAENSRNTITNINQKWNSSDYDFSHSISTGESTVQNKRNEDSYLYFEEEKFILSGVFDGHGDQKKCSSFASEYLKNHLLDRINEKREEELNLEETIFFAFQECLYEINESEDFSKFEGGTTVCLVYIDKQNGNVYTATLGDSEAMLYHENENTLNTLKLSVKKDWTSPNEKTRAEKLYLTSTDSQLYKKNKKRHYWDNRGISVSKSLGDRTMPAVGKKVKISCCPIPFEGHSFIVIGTDGVWTRIRDEKEWLGKIKKSHARDLTNYVYDRYNAFDDDSTLIKIEIKNTQNG